MNLCLFTLSLSLSSGSLLGSLLSGSGESLSLSFALCSDSLCLSLVGLNFLSVQFLGGSDLLVSLFLRNLAVLLILLNFPSIETTLSFSLVECALGDTAAEVLHQHNAFVRKDVANRVSGLCTNRDPIHSAVEVQINLSRIEIGVVRADAFNDFTVTRGAAVCYHDVIVSIVLVAVTSQTNFCCHLFFVVFMDYDYTSRVSGLIKMVCFLHEKACKGTAFFGNVQIFSHFFCICQKKVVILQPIVDKAMQFRDIIGHESVKDALRRSVLQGRVSHARLLTGPSGVGKLRLAIAYAQYLACEHRTAEDSCGVCPSCLQFQRLEHPDLHFVFPIVKNDAGDTCDAFVAQFRQLILEKGYFDLDDWYSALGVETKQGMIYEKESGEILRKLSLKSFADGYKVMIIWEADKMNATCANKLLKILEEPADKTVFILITEHPEWLLQTILSRVQPTRVGRIEDAELEKHFPHDIVRIANGSYLEAQRLQQGSEQRDKYFDDFVRLMRDAYTIGQIKDVQKKWESLLRLKQWSQEMADAKVGRERQKAFLQ